MTEDRGEPSIGELADAFRRHLDGGELAVAVRDGCKFVEAVKSSLNFESAMALLGAMAAGADFSRCADTAAKYIAIALTNMPRALSVLEDQLRKFVLKLEENGRHREAFLIAIACAVGGSPEILDLVRPRSWAEEVLYVEELSSFVMTAVDGEVRYSLSSLALRAIEGACRAGSTPCRYAKAALLPKVAVSLLYDRHYDLAEEYIETALKAFEELQQQFNVEEMREYLDLTFPLGWDEGKARTIVDHLATLIYPIAASVYRGISSEKMYSYLEEWYKRVAGTPYEFNARVDMARFAYVFNKISLQQLAEEIGKVYEDMAESGYMEMKPRTTSRVVKLYVLTLAALGRGRDAVEHYAARRNLMTPLDRYAVESYFALLGLIDRVEDKVKIGAAISLIPQDEHLACIFSGACPPEVALAERNDTAAALVLDLASRGEWEKALEVAERYTDMPDQKEEELWDAVIVALENKDREALKKAALNLLVYVG